MASETIKFSLLLRSPANSSFRCESSPEFVSVSSISPISSSSRLYSAQKSLCLRSRICAIGGKIGILNDRIEEGSSQLELDDESPVVVDLDPICSENQFDQILAEAQQIGEPVIIVCATFDGAMVSGRKAAEALLRYNALHFIRVQDA